MKGKFFSVAIACFLIPNLAPVSASAQTPATRPAAASRPITLVVPREPGTHRLATQVTVNGRSFKFPFVLYLPDSYRLNGPKMPVLLFLHGSGECGTDLDAIFYHGPNFELVKKDNDSFRHNFPMIVVSPQCPPRGQRWDQQEMFAAANVLLDQLLPKLNADPDHVYATGLSMGGIGTWHVAVNRPDRFAAIAPISSIQLEPDKTAHTLKQLAVLAITGVGDTQQIEESHRMVAALNKEGGLAQFSEGPGVHAVWIPAYANPLTYEWLLMHTRGKLQPTTNPAAPKYPEHTGLHSMALRLADDPDPLLYTLYLPADIRPKEQRSLLIYLSEPTTFGIYHDGVVLHGPGEQLADPRTRKNLPFIYVQPNLPPFAPRWDDPQNIRRLNTLLQQLIERYHPDPQRIYIVASDTGAAAALQLAREAKVPFAAALLNVRSDCENFVNVEPVKNASTVVLAFTDSNQGRVYDRLRELIAGSSNGSDMVVLREEELGSSIFSQADLYQRLSKIKLKTK